jgi:hypothetical protein
MLFQDGVATVMVGSNRRRWRAISSPSSKTGINT